MKRRVLIILVSFLMAISAVAQSDKEPSNPPVKEYNGLFPVLGFLGGKLIGELQTRFNLNEEADTVQKEKVPVRLNLGYLKMETTMTRKKKT